MYVREETIEEENLDWGIDPEKIVQEADEKIDETIHVMHPDAKNDQIHFHQRMNRKINIKQRIMSVIDDHTEFSLLFGIVIVPYMLGFIISYFLFYFYGGMSFNNFLTVEQVPTAIELWSIGAYLFVTVGTVLAFFIP